MDFSLTFALLLYFNLFYFGVYVCLEFCLLCLKAYSLSYKYPTRTLVNEFFTLATIVALETYRLLLGQKHTKVSTNCCDDHCVGGLQNFSTIMPFYSGRFRQRAGCRVPHPGVDGPFHVRRGVPDGLADARHQARHRIWGNHAGHSGVSDNQLVCFSDVQIHERLPAAAERPHQVMHRWRSHGSHTWGARASTH